MAQYLAPEQLENSSGVPLNGGKKHVYQVATTTPLALFSDESLSTPVANPIVADASGAFAGVFLAETKCKQIVTTSADVTVFTRAVDYTIGVTNTIAADDVSYDNASSGLAAETLQEAIDEVVDLQGTSQSWTSSADGPIATGTSTNTGAAAGPLVEMYRNSASPANSDVIGGMRLTAKNASGTKTTMAEVHGVITDTTNASEDAKVVVQTVVAGALADRVHVGGGLWGNGATGGDPGAGKANFTEVQRDGNGIQPLVNATVQASTSGTSIDFSSIPSWVKRITITLVGVSKSGTSRVMVQIGDSGGIEATGYLGTADSTNFTTGFGVGANSAAAILHGMVFLTLHEASSNTWVSGCLVGGSDSAFALFGGGSKALSATLDRVRITTLNGTDTFDAGSINVLYE
jgi:hypothetical protein